MSFENSTLKTLLTQFSEMIFAPSVKICLAKIDVDTVVH